MAEKLKLNDNTCKLDAKYVVKWRHDFTVWYWLMYDKTLFRWRHFLHGGHDYQTTAVSILSMLNCFILYSIHRVMMCAICIVYPLSLIIWKRTNDRMDGQTDVYNFILSLFRATEIYYFIKMRYFTHWSTVTKLTKFTSQFRRAPVQLIQCYHSNNWTIVISMTIMIPLVVVQNILIYGDFKF